jgi:transcriptional regulator of acetoin/glycerol metabolism
MNQQGGVGGNSSLETSTRAQGVLALLDHGAMVERSHRRSAGFGLAVDQKPDFAPQSRPDLSIMLEQNRHLVEFAVPVMESVFQNIRHTHSIVVLTDADGIILRAFGEDDFLPKAEKLAIRPGVAWSEQYKGTNAIGTAIAELSPARIHAKEHYLTANRVLTCSAAPIFDHQGRVAGVLDITGDYRSVHDHTMALVRMSAQIIERQLSSAAFDNAITLHFHARTEMIGTLDEGIASFTPGGRFLSANRAALLLLGLPLASLQSYTFSSLFNLPLSLLVDHHRSATPSFLSLILQNGQQFFARTELRLGHQMFHLDLPANEPAAEPATRAAIAVARQAGRSHLRDLNTGDERMALAIDKVSKVLGHDIPILIVGETGTGKELFAQAIHHDSPQSDGPFVAINCASIPDTLIESELFGYEDGAFTGARKSGKVGKLLQANGGTLFLDEIGDMPLHLQARLLRVLQERMVTPLGSVKSIPVRVAIICATNRNLRDMIAAGAFREDLYYRLNGLVVKLPAARERTDLQLIVRKFLANESRAQRVTVSDEVMQLFKQYHWPGNFRQLTNLLRTALVLAGDKREIGIEHLPDDFLEDIVPTDESRLLANVDQLRSTGQKLEDLNLSVIRETLEAHHGNISATAKALGVSRNTIYRKIQ